MRPGVHLTVVLLDAEERNCSLGPLLYHQNFAVPPAFKISCDHCSSSANRKLQEQVRYNWDDKSQEQNREQ